eukprot:GILI01006109.1.p1 GENE.GILI01006109.1~~GILI01006109.1.p1  ORF type:complete len:433 (+),score=55.39 GILI01006109.1:70-1299(+)
MVSSPAARELMLGRGEASRRQSSTLTPKKVIVRAINRSNAPTSTAQGPVSLPNLLTRGVNLGSPNTTETISQPKTSADPSETILGNQPASPFSNPRTLRVRQSMRTNYESRLAALEEAENEQRVRLAEPYRKRLMEGAGNKEGDVDSGDGGAAGPHSDKKRNHSVASSSASSPTRPPESVSHRKRRESKENSAFTNPYNNAYYAFFQSEEGDDEAWGKAMGLPPGALSGPGAVPPPLPPSATHPHRSPSAATKGGARRTSSTHSHDAGKVGGTLSVSGGYEGNEDDLNPQHQTDLSLGDQKPRSRQRRFSSNAEKVLAEQHLAKQPQWRQKELKESRHYLATLHPTAATIYVKLDQWIYSNAHQLTVLEAVARIPNRGLAASTLAGPKSRGVSWWERTADVAPVPAAFK